MQNGRSRTIQSNVEMSSISQTHEFMTEKRNPYWSTKNSEFYNIQYSLDSDRYIHSNGISYRLWKCVLHETIENIELKFF